MLEVLTGLATPHWILSVWSTDVRPAQQRLESTLKARRRKMPPQRIRVSPTEGVSWPGATSESKSATLEAGLPVFFENHTYEFAFKLQYSRGAKVRHRNQRIANAFRCDDKTLRGTLNFGNDVGWFELDLEVTGGCGRPVNYRVGFEVLPSKLDMETDMSQILAEIDAVYPLWRFSFARPTTQGMERSRKAFQRLPLIWLEQFKALRKDLERHVQLICNAPHHRLQEYARTLRPEQLRGKLAPKREEAVGEACRLNDVDRRIQVASRRLSVNTPENRFVRAVLVQCDLELERFQSRLELALREPSRARSERISQEAIDEIAAWRKGLRGLLAHQLWKQVGPFFGLRRESLVLQERSGYSGVYRIWLQLRMYLEVLGRHTTISMKSIAQLYEVWCFLEVGRQLEALGFRRQTVKPPKMNYSGLEAKLSTDGMGAAFKFERGTDASGTLVRVRLAHEPQFGRRCRSLEGRHVVSWLNVQEPDIVLEAEFPNGERLFWVFDAKYQVWSRGATSEQIVDDEQYDSDDDLPASVGDWAPAAAINQMHRYRDAIVCATRTAGAHPALSRPVIGAFCLFPGWYPDEEQVTGANPYQDSIETVGIGAFPVLPGQKNLWLLQFLESQLGRERELTLRSSRGPEWQLAQWGPRIEPAGLNLRRAGEVVLVAHIGGGRSAAYEDAFRSGIAKWFHVRDLALVRGSIAASAMRDVTHCAVAVPNVNRTESLVFSVYSVKQVCMVNREEISALQAGIAKSEHTGMYWLFELGDSVGLDVPLRYQPAKQFRVWLTSLRALTSAPPWRT